MNVKSCIRIMCLFSALFLVSCGSEWVIKNEKPQKLNLNSYKNIYVDWIDLDENRWKEFGWEKKAAWVAEIKDINKGWFQGQLKKNFKGHGKKLIFAKKNKSKPNGDLRIHIYNTHIDVQRSAWHALDYIDLNLSFIDLKNKKEIYKSTVKVSSKRFGPHGWTFQGRMGFAVANLADFIALKFDFQPVQ